MVNHGARNLIITSRRGPVDATAKTLVAGLQSNSVRIATPSCDITDKKALAKVISLALSDMPPVCGCIQASTVLSVSLSPPSELDNWAKVSHLHNGTLQDDIFSEMPAEEWHRAVKVTVTGSRNLWEVLTSKDTTSALDFFIMLSSLTGVTGNNGQSDYSAGN